MLNRIILMGRLTRDPELKTTPQGVSVCTVTLAVERAFVRQGEQRETDFIDVVAWRQTAEFVSKYFRKGLLVAVEGRLQSRKWKDKYDQNRVSFEVIADNVYFAERAEKPESGYDRVMNEATRAGVPPCPPRYDEPAGYPTDPLRDYFAGVEDDDVPF